MQRSRGPFVPIGFNDPHIVLLRKIIGSRDGMGTYRARDSPISVPDYVSFFSGQLAGLPVVDVDYTRRVACTLKPFRVHRLPHSPDGTYEYR
ncbi:unnamed protein product, partial [Iphiclides podalirius]